MVASSPMRHDIGKEAGKDDGDSDFKTELLALIPFLRAFARSLTGNQEGADDLAQETLVKAWQSRSTFIPGTNLKAWLFTILRNQFYSDRRRAWRQAPWDQDAAERIPGGGEDQVFSAQLSDTARALRCLSDEQREALILVGAGGFSYEDAAAICKCAVGTVKSRVARARKALMEILDGDDTLEGVARPAEGDAAREIMAQLDRLTPTESGTPVENAAPNNLSEGVQADRGWTLRQRLLLIITIALLPVAVVSIFQGVERVKRDTQDVSAQLIQSAKTTAADEDNVLTAGEQILRAMGALKDVREISSNCDSIMADAMIGVSYFTNLSRIDPNGTLVCSAVPLSKGINIGKLPIFAAVKSARGVVVGTRSNSLSSGRPVVGSQLPLHNPDGSFDGSVAITLDAQWFGYLLRSHPMPKNAVAVIYDRNGAILATNDDQVAPAIAAVAKNAGFPSGVSLDARQGGQGWRFGTVALVGNTLFVAFGQRETQLFGQTYLHVGIDFLLPIAMILFAWIAISIATDRQVTQWIAHLRRIAIAYRSGHYTIRPDLADAPSEFKQLGEAMSAMAEGIQDRDQRLRDSVNMKTVLIREIHHRVKNNLQIVMSLLSIQANQVKDPTARDALMQAQTRINALALVHRILNELEDQSTLDLKQLIDELARQIAEGIGNTKNVRVEVDVPHMVVSSNVAVAVALFTVEALTNIFKHAFPRQAQGVIRVILKPDGEGRLKLTVADDGIGFATDETGRSVGSRLIRTFGAQLGGVSSVRSDPGKGTEVELIFPDPTIRDRGEAARMPQQAQTVVGE